MSLLNPWFLVGLAGLAVPVLIHLFHRQQKEPIRFPSLMFLERIPFRTVRRQTLRDPLLFAVRALLLLLLVGAFTRPFVGGDAGVGSVEGAREVVVLLDQSYSMGYADRFERAKQAARDVGATLQPGDAVSLIVYGNEATSPVRSAGAVELSAAIDTLQPRWDVTRFPPALEAGSSVLRASSRPRRELIIVSDLQSSAWAGSDDVLLPPGTVVQPVSIVEGASPNLILAGASARRLTESDRVRVQVSARVVNSGSTARSGVPVTLELDGVEAETVAVDLGAGADVVGSGGSADGGDGTASVTFRPFVLARADTRVVVRLPDDALAADDRLHLVLSPEPDRRVLLVRPRGARADQSLFVQRALTVGEGQSFQVDERRADQVQVSDLARPSVVVLNGAAPPSGVATDRLVEWVRDGGGLLVALDERSEWPAEHRDLLGGTFAAPQNRGGTRGGSLGYVAYDHPVFELFQGPRSGDLTGVRFFRHRPFEPDSTTRVLARFDDGAVALAETRFGEGRVLVWTAGLDNFWSDFPLHPVYLPFVQSLTDFLSGREDRPDQRAVGDLVDIVPLVPDPGESSLVAMAPSGADETVRADSAGTHLLRLREPGFYEVRADEPDAARRPLAANVDRVESNLSFMDPEQIVQALAPEGGAAEAGGGGSEALPANVVERGQSLWRYLILLALTLLLAETWLSNRGAQGRARARSSNPSEQAKN